LREIRRNTKKNKGSKEVAYKKAQQRNRTGDYYIKYTSESKAGITYDNLSTTDTFGKLRLNGFVNKGGEYLVKLAKDKLNCSDKNRKVR